jgi:mRNA interferase MazF
MGRIVPKRGEVWWVNFDPSLGSEVQKVRPAIVVSNDSANKHLDRFQVVPLTSNIDRIYPGEAQVIVSKKPGKAMANQLTTVSQRRLSKKYTVLAKPDMLAVDVALKVQLSLDLE